MLLAEGIQADNVNTFKNRLDRLWQHDNFKYDMSYESPVNFKYTRHTKEIIYMQDLIPEARACNQRRT